MKRKSRGRELESKGKVREVEWNLSKWNRISWEGMGEEGRQEMFRGDSTLGYFG